MSIAISRYPKTSDQGGRYRGEGGPSQGQQPIRELEEDSDGEQAAEPVAPPGRPPVAFRQVDDRPGQPAAGAIQAEEAPRRAALRERIAGEAADGDRPSGTSTSTKARITTAQAIASISR